MICCCRGEPVTPRENTTDERIVTTTDELIVAPSKDVKKPERTSEPQPSSELDGFDDSLKLDDNDTVAENPTIALSEPKGLDFAPVAELVAEPVAATNPETEPLVATTLEASLAEIKSLCASCRLFEAYKLLSDLEAKPFSQRQLQADADLERLRKRQARWDTEWVPHAAMCLKKDAKWSDVEESIPDIGPSARIRIQGRYLEGADRDPKGAIMQGAAIQEFLGIPVAFEVFMSAMIEADTLSAKMFDGCKLLHGVPGGPERFRTAYKHLLIQAPIVSFMKVYDHLMTDVILCLTPPAGFEEFGPGMLMFDWSLPDTDVDASGQYDGFKILDKPSWGFRIQQLAIIYITPSEEAPGCTNVTVLVKLAAPIFEWLISPKTAMKMLLTMAKGNMQKWKENICDDMPKLAELATRRQKSADFYAALEQIRASKA